MDRGSRNRRDPSRAIVEEPYVKVIASSIRKGNIIEREDGQLCVVLSAESFHPGKGTPTTQIDMRRLSDGVKVTDRFKTTEQVERAFVEDKNYDFLYSDPDGYHFMNNETYDQYEVNRTLFGDDALYLKEDMDLQLMLDGPTVIDYQLPTTMTYTVAEAEVAIVGNTSGAVTKKVKTDTGLSITVPNFISEGEIIKVDTRDGSYVGRG